MTEKPNLYALVGMKFRRAEDLVARLMAGTEEEPMTLVREPKNKFDGNAIQVWARGQHVGYVSKDQNKALAAFIDQQGEPNLPMAYDSSGMRDATAEGLGKTLKAKLHRGRNTYPLVEIA